LLNEQMGNAVELMVVGDVPARLKTLFDGEYPGLVTWAGVQQRQRIAEIDRSAQVLFSADLNAACPNSVIEALACGLPVVSYATGSLPELIEGDAGLVVPWGSNFWKLEPPDLPMLADAAQRIFKNQAHFRLAARKRAEAAFGLDQMVDRYLEALLD
jgi:glycosyltransferase involved in cell wall biosynthesis